MEPSTQSHEHLDVRVELGELEVENGFELWVEVGLRVPRRVLYDRVDAGAEEHASLILVLGLEELQHIAGVEFFPSGSVEFARLDKRLTKLVEFLKREVRLDK